MSTLTLRAPDDLDKALERQSAALGISKSDLAREALKGGRKGQYSIRINGEWRLCFEWPKGSNGPLNVEIVDYH